MPPVEYDDLSEDVQMMIAELQVKVQDLEYESQFYRFAVLISVIVAAERIWERFF